ncbi:hypothetical protein CFO_g4153 [Ceratocystis platani]|uniref:Uncharacterized protein n=1 Tax=Ceratocystis fimbriata f. sp. platani TaxID=88771 RepID=A0A0F8AYQ7_CERFI|nr:hypothetical protein CFO_g4153 [Ceratocystis platani]
MTPAVDRAGVEETAPAMADGAIGEIMAATVAATVAATAFASVIAIVTMIMIVIVIAAAVSAVIAVVVAFQGTSHAQRPLTTASLELVMALVVMKDCQLGTELAELVMP